MSERSDREEGVGEAVAWYFQAIEAGRSPSPAEFLARFPDLRPELESFLADKAAFDRAAWPPADPDATIPPSVTPNLVTIAHVPSDDPDSTLPPSPSSDATLPPSGSPPAAEGPRGSVRYFGDYELLAEIARGGMGVVFKARQVSLNREVALKMILSGQLAGAADIARFHAEAEAAANLDHPNILPIYEVGEYQGQQYFAMKLAPGGSLAGKVGGLVQDPRAAAEVFAKVCRAVDFAHRRGILHRDLKPGNILLDVDGTPYVTDFGLAKKVEGDSNLTQSGAIVGTPSYMAPEQARAEKGLTTAADLYALGAILYELLTGQPPFRGPTMLDTILQVIEKEPADPRTLNPKADRDLSVIALKCLEKDPGKRYESAGALADDLDRWGQGEPILARPVGRLERVVKWVKRNPVVTAAAAAVVLALTVGTTVSYLKYRDAEEQRKDAETQKGIAEARRIDAEKEAEKAKKAREFLVSIFQKAETDVKGGNVTVRQLLAEADTEIPVAFADQSELRGELVAALGNVKRGIARRTPQAMILEVRGAVQLLSAAGKSKAAVPQALVNLDDRLSLSADAQVQLVFLSDFHKERLHPGREATISTSGCEPATAVRERDNSILMTFVRLPKGTFYSGWGSSVDLKGKTTIKGVKTEIKEDFEIAVHDVTQGQWEAVMGTNPSWFSRTGNGRSSVVDISDEELKLFPVESVSWGDCQEFLKKLNEKEKGSGWVYRLPSESEWEYSCRVGATSEDDCSYHFYFAKPVNDLSSKEANFNGSYPFGEAENGPALQRTTRVGAYPANRLGLYDMHGNVYQWCADLYAPKASEAASIRMVRGGSWSTRGSLCRAGYRTGHAPWARLNDNGLRLARVPSAPAGK